MKARTVVLSIAAAAILLQASNTGAQTTNPPYLREMPTVERVKAEIKGTDAIDTAARQAGAFWQLRAAIYKMAISQHRNDRQVTPDEKRLADAYYAAWYSVWEPVQKALAQDRPRLFKLEGYTADPDVLSEVLERLCSPAFRAEYYKAVGQVETRKQVRREAARAEQAQVQAGATQPVAPTNPCPVTDQPKTTKPGVRPNSTLSVIGMGYVYTVTNLKTGAVVSQTRGNFSNATLYLLDDDAENVLQSAGMGPGLMGDRFTMLAFTQGMAQGDKVPVVGELLSTPIGQDAATMVSEAKADLECVMRAVRAHSAAEMTTDANARGTFPSVPAGTYYLYGWYYRVREPVRAGPVAWNLKVELKPGQNTLRLSVRDAAYAP